MRRCGRRDCLRGTKEYFVILNLFQDNAPPSIVILEPKAGKAKTSSG
jgi:hypothetical protein